MESLHKSADNNLTNESSTDANIFNVANFQQAYDVLPLLRTIENKDFINTSIIKMKLGIFVAVAVLGLLTLTEGKFPRLRIDPHGRLDPEDADKITSEVENAVNEEWQKYAEEDTDGETLFTAPKLKSDIRGKLMYTLKEERKIYAYQGFRFGKAERFLPPEDLGNYWSDHLGDEAFNATHIGLKCPQGSGGDEDCLFLNVYTPYKPGTNEAKNLTVMFFIHGGAFVLGSSATYMPTKLLNHDVILVTTHYRLGAFGFYTRNSRKAPGNLAFYDMVSALRWVQTYISDFGGNPELVTIFGESAGSVSVNYMMLLTKEENLFRAVIAESGAALDHWAFDEDYTYATNYYEHYVGCDIYETEDEILDCMRKVPFQDLLEAGQKMISEDRRNGLIGFRGCSPTIQTFNDTGLDFANILYQHPRDFMINRDFKDVPFLTGANREEGSLVVGIMFLDYLVPNDLLFNDTYKREGMMRDLLLSVGVSDEPEGIAHSLQKLYCDGVDLAKLEEAQYCLIDIGGILFLKAGSWQMSNYHSYYSTHETFYYSFEFESDDMVGEVSIGDYSFYAGVSHGDEIKYIFSGFAIMDAENGQEDIYQRMTLMWTNFARYLDPTPDEDKSWESMGIPKWIPYKFEEPHFLLIDRDFSMKEDFSERWTITNKLYGPQPPESDECVGVCADYEDQRQAFMITMIVFIIAFVISCLGAIFFFFKARG